MNHDRLSLRKSREVERYREFVHGVCVALQACFRRSSGKADARTVVANAITAH